METAAYIERRSDCNQTLFSPYQLNRALTLKNRLIMSPMTRCKAVKGLIPNPKMASYYAKRAQAGLIVTEATIISPDGQGYPFTPGIFLSDQINGWRYITDEIHQHGGIVFNQIWHVGRVSHPVYLNGKEPIAPSAVNMTGSIPHTQGQLQYGTPRALNTSEIPHYIDLFIAAARNAIKANFDGIEIHAGNGYLIDQFLHYHTNNRIDQYGQTPENMSRFLLNLLDGVIAELGNDRIGVRISPAAYTQQISADNRDANVFIYLLQEISKRHIAYIHAAIDQHDQYFPSLQGSVTNFIRKHYHGNFIANGGFTPQSARIALQNQETDLVSLGRPFLANPDLIEKLQNGEPLRSYSPALLHDIN